MAATSTAAIPSNAVNNVSEGAWALAWRRFKSDRVGVWSGITVIFCLLVV